MAGSPGYGGVRIRNWDYNKSFTGKSVGTSITGAMIWRGTKAVEARSSLSWDGYGAKTTLWSGVEFPSGGGGIDTADPSVLCSRGWSQYSETGRVVVYDGDILCINMTRFSVPRPGVIGYASQAVCGPLQLGQDELVFSVYTRLGSVRSRGWVDLHSYRLPINNVQHSSFNYLHNVGSLPFGQKPDGTYEYPSGFGYHAMFWFRINIVGLFGDAVNGSITTDGVDKCGQFLPYYSSGSCHQHSGIPPRPDFATLQKTVDFPQSFVQTP